VEIEEMWTLIQANPANKQALEKIADRLASKVASNERQKEKRKRAAVSAPNDPNSKFLEVLL